jgi:hypothetical protein
VVGNLQLEISICAEMLLPLIMSTCRAFVVDGLGDSCVGAREGVSDEVGGHISPEEAESGVLAVTNNLKMDKAVRNDLESGDVCDNGINFVVDKICDEGGRAHRYTCTLKPVNRDTVADVGQAQEGDVGRQGAVDDVLCLLLRMVATWEECGPLGDIEVEAEIVLAVFTEVCGQGKRL